MQGDSEKLQAANEGMILAAYDLGKNALVMDYLRQSPKPSKPAVMMALIAAAKHGSLTQVQEALGYVQPALANDAKVRCWVDESDWTEARSGRSAPPGRLLNASSPILNVPRAFTLHGPPLRHPLFQGNPAPLIIATHAAHLHALLRSDANRSEQIEAAELALKDFQTAGVHEKLVVEFKTALRGAMEAPKEGAVGCGDVRAGRDSASFSGPVHDHHHHHTHPAASVTTFLNHAQLLGLAQKMLPKMNTKHTSVRL